MSLIEDQIKLIDSYQNSIDNLIKLSTKLRDALQELDEKLTHPCGVFSNEITEAELEGFSWEDAEYEYFSDMSINDIPESLMNMKETLEAKKEELRDQSTREKLYDLIYKNVLGSPESIDPSAVTDIYEYIRGISNQSKEDFFRHIVKASRKGEN